MEDYKKEIYNLWSRHNPVTSPDPSDKDIEAKFIYYRYYINNFFPASREAQILDLGCGRGLFLNSCQRLGYTKIKGVEAVSDYLKFIENKFSIKTVVQADIFDYLNSVPDLSFDVITAFDVIEHFRKEEVIGLLRLIHSKLKPAGKFIMQVPNAGSLAGLRIFFSDLTHEWAYTNLLIEEIFSSSGFGQASVQSAYEPKNIKLSLIQAIRKFLLTIIFGHLEFSLSENLVAIAHK